MTSQFGIWVVRVIRMLLDRETFVSNVLDLFSSELVSQVGIPEILLAMHLSWRSHEEIIQLNDNQKCCEVHDFINHFRSSFDTIII